MNREIKFRGITEAGKWVYGCLVNNMWTYSELTERNKQKVCEIITGEYAGDCWEEAAFDEDCVVTAIPESVGQYTGLKDKNGKEIYEGDICLIKALEEWKESFNMIGIRPVVFNSDSAQFSFSQHIPMNWGGNESIEIIGNIYQNPELLK